MFLKKILIKFKLCYICKRNKIKINNNVVVSCVNFGKHITIDSYSRLIGVPNIEIGDNTYINCSCHILGEIKIVKNVLIGPKTIIWGRDHVFSDVTIPINKQGHDSRPIIIEDDVWIGAGVIVLKGVTIHKGAVVGAGSIVTKDIPPYVVVAGNPARILKKRCENK